MKAPRHQELFAILKLRFEKNKKRHEGVEWHQVQTRLEANPNALDSLQQMEQSGGEPDVVHVDLKSGEFHFFDCCAESPKERRSLCYDREALDSRKEFKPESSAVEKARSMGIEILNEEQYRQLQTLGNFDCKTSSWLQTPPEIRKLGGAIFGDRRYNHVFVYHNGASSYYAARGFRGALKV